MKITDPTVVKNPLGKFYINNELDHEELDIICEAMSIMIHKGITDPDRRDRTLTLYSELFSFWEATTLDSQKPAPDTLIKKDVMVAPICPKNMTWNPVTEQCDVNEGFYKDEFGSVKPIPVTNCGNNAHFDNVLGCVCNEGFIRDKSGNCVPEPTKENVIITEPK